MEDQGEPVNTADMLLEVRGVDYAVEEHAVHDGLEKLVGILDFATGAAVLRQLLTPPTVDLLFY